MRQVGNDACLSSLICFCCGQIYTNIVDPDSPNRGEIDTVALRVLLQRSPRELLEYAFGLDAFLAHFVNPAPDHCGTPSHHYPTHSTSSSPWLRTLTGMGPNGGVNSLRLVCCPVDGVCGQAHGARGE